VSTVADTQKANNYEWYTPAKYIALVKEVLGEIDLDPASCEQANKTVGAKRYFTKEDDGLRREWFGKIFLNPPYSNMMAWVDKLLGELSTFNTEAILLANACTDTQWFHYICKVADTINISICFVEGRIKFDSPYRNSQKENGSERPSIFICFGHKHTTTDFNRVFSQIGHVVEL